MRGAVFSTRYNFFLLVIKDGICLRNRKRDKMPSWKKWETWCWLYVLIGIPNSFIISIPFHLEYGWNADNILRIWMSFAWNLASVYTIQPIMLWVENKPSLSQAIKDCISWTTLLVVQAATTLFLLYLRPDAIGYFIN